MPNYEKNTVINDTELYYNLIQKRNKLDMEHHGIKTFNINRDVKLTSIQHIWSHGDRLYKLSYRYYGEHQHWWLIAFFNSKPTDSHYKYGDVVDIPMPLHRALETFGDY